MAPEPQEIRSGKSRSPPAVVRKSRPGEDARGKVIVTTLASHLDDAVFAEEYDAGDGEVVSLDFDRADLWERGPEGSWRIVRFVGGPVHPPTGG